MLSIKLSSMDQVPKPANARSTVIRPEMESQADLGATERQHKDVPRLPFSEGIGAGLVELETSNYDDMEDRYSILLPHETRSPADAPYGGMMKSRHRSAKTKDHINLARSYQSTKQTKPQLSIAGTMDLRSRVSPFKESRSNEELKAEIVKLHELNKGKRQKADTLSKTVADSIKRTTLSRDEPYAARTNPVGGGQKPPPLSLHSKKAQNSPRIGITKYDVRSKPMTAKASGHKPKLTGVGKDYLTSQEVPQLRRLRRVAGHRRKRRTAG